MNDQNDNARIHKAETVNEWLEYLWFLHMDWPLQGPDVNGTENVCRKLYAEGQLSYNKFKTFVERLRSTLDINTC